MVSLKEIMSENDISFIFLKRNSPKQFIIFIAVIIHKAFMDTQIKDEMCMQNIWR